MAVAGPRRERETTTKAPLNASVTAASGVDRESFLQALTCNAPSAADLGALFSEWCDTGLSGDGEERPFERDIWRTSKALGSCEDFIKRNPPRIVLKDGGHRIFLPAPEIDVQIASWVSPLHFPGAASDVAVADFIYFLGMPWCFEFSKCRECGRYFDMGRSPKTVYPFGIHCSLCQRSQANKAAVEATNRARMIRMTERIVLAGEALATWQEHSASPDSGWILQRAVTNNRHEVKRLKLTANWVTRHRDEINRAAKMIAAKRKRHGSL
jgi:hypothetical protein